MNDFKDKISNSTLKNKDKRELYYKLLHGRLTIEDKEKILNMQKRQGGYMSFMGYIGSMFSGNTFLKLLLSLSLIVGIWVLYSHPSGIKVRGFIGSIYKIRSVLATLKDENINLYNLVKNNIDEINIDYIALPGNIGGHATMRGDTQIVRIYRPLSVEKPYLTQLIVHEACHGHQGRNQRFGAEPRQKLESECHYLGIFTIETIFPEEHELLSYLYYEATKKNGIWGDGWKESWRYGDTTQGLSDILPKEKIQEYKYFGNHYHYD